MTSTLLYIIYYSTLTIEEFNGDIETERAKCQNIPTTPIPYYRVYEQMIFNDYERTNYEPGLIYLDEVDKSKISRGVTWLLKKIGSTILAGQSVMSISLPVFVFDKRTLHEVFACEHRGAPYYLSHAAHATDKYERMKWMVVYVISQFYISSFQIKPFNPILGETFQCKIGNMNFYSEQTANHPITSNFYCFDDEGLYKIHGYILTYASTGANSVTAKKKGKYEVTFKDGTNYRIYLPYAYITGITMGKRLYNYTEKMCIVDNTNKLCACVQMNPDKVGYWKSWFTSKQQTFPDTFIGKVVKLEDVVLSDDSKHQIKDNAVEFVNIKGEWTDHCSFDDEVYWNVNDNKLFTINEVGYKCPSDGRYRKDLIELIKGNEEQSQIEKEAMENIQRRDRKLRAEWKKNK